MNLLERKFKEKSEEQEFLVGAKHTGLPIGGWYPVDEDGNIIKDTPYGEMPRRFPTGEKAIQAGI